MHVLLGTNFQHVAQKFRNHPEMSEISSKTSEICLHGAIFFFIRPKTFQITNTKFETLFEMYAWHFLSQNFILSTCEALHAPENRETLGKKSGLSKPPQSPILAQNPHPVDSTRAQPTATCNGAVILAT